MKPATRLLLLLLLTMARLPLASGAPDDTAPVRPADRIALEITFEGLTAYSEREVREYLYEQIGGLEREGLNLPGADDTAFFLELKLRKDGYADAFVDYEILSPTHLLLTVDQGPRSIVESTQFPGATAFDHSTLEAFLLGPTRERHSVFDGPLPFVPSLLDEGVGLLRRFYIEQGFRDVEVAPPTMEPVETRRRDVDAVEVIVDIREGLQYSFGDLEFRGDLIFSPMELLQQLRAQTLRPYSIARETALARRLQAFYIENGYFNARVVLEPIAVPEGVTTIPVRFIVDPGPRFYVQAIRVQSSDRLPASFFEKRFRRLVAQPYNPRRLDRIHRQLLQTGIFSSLRTQPVEVGPDQLALDITAVTGRTKEFGIYGGYGSYEGYIIGGSFANLNLFNSGRSGRVDAEMTGRGFRGSLTYEDPWFLDQNIGFVARASFAQQERDDYSKRTIGASALWNFNWRQFQVSTGFQPRQTSVFDTSLLLVQTGPRDYFINSYGIALLYDRRDSRLNPRRGWVISFALDYANNAIGSEIDFIRLVYRAAYFQPIGPLTLSLAMQGGVLFPEGNTTIIPIDERFFSGGSTTVRSFGERQLTPRTIFGQGLGGNSTTVFNIELDFPLYEELRGAVFVDAGNVLRGTRPFDLSDMRYGVGVGVRLAMPVGRLRLDFAVNPNPTRFEDFGAFHFGFGFLF